MSKADWKDRAEALFFIEKLSIENISFKLGISRRSISKFLNSLPEYVDEVNRRKDETAAKRREYEKSEERREYKRTWDAKNRSGSCHIICSESLKREHITAVKILSRERYFK